MRTVVSNRPLLGYTSRTWFEGDRFRISGTTTINENISTQHTLLGTFSVRLTCNQGLKISALVQFCTNSTQTTYTLLS